MWQINLLQLNLISVTFCSHVSSQIKSAYFSNQFSWKKRQICFYFKLLNVTHSRYCISKRGIFVCLFVCLFFAFFPLLLKSHEWKVFVLSFQVAIKSIRKEKIKDEQDMVHIRREIEIMSSLRHPHIISIYEGEGLWMSTCDKSWTLI